MKRRITKLSLALIAVALLLAMLPMSALAAQSGDYTYTVSNGKATITKYTGSDNDISISSTLGGYPVTGIGDEAFFSCISVGSVTIPESVTSIGNNAFSGCIGLASVTIPSSVTSIGEKAFYGCTDLRGVTIPGGVTSIGMRAFASCDALSAILVNPSNTKYSSHDNVLFNKTRTQLIQYSIGHVRTSYKIPSSVTSIGESAFEDSQSLTSVMIPSGVTGIKEAAFRNCRNLIKATIPGSVNSIGERAFDYCSNLTSVTIANGVTDIGTGAFGSCWSLASITIPGSVASIGEDAFGACRSLTSVTIPSGVVSIGRWAFAACWNLTSFTISDTVTSIGREAFAYSYKLSTIHVNATNPEYSSQDGVLFNKARTELVQFPAGHAKTAYTIPSGVTTIGPWAFGDSRSLTSVTFPGSVASIKQEAFVYCGKMKYAFFQGNAPATDKFVFDCGSDFTVYYRKGKTGFTNPWHGYPTATYVLPAAPTVKAVMATQTSAKLTWGAVAGAAKYEVYRATSVNGAYTKRAETASASYTDTTLAAGTVYYYKVRAYGLVDSTKVYGVFSAAVSPSTPATPVNVKAASASYNSVKLTWSVVAGASGYAVYRATAGNGPYTLAAVLTSGSTVSYTNAGLTTGTPYFYKVRAYRMVGTAKVHGDYSAAVSAKPVPAVPAGGKAASASYNSIKLTWGAVAGASGYAVYRATAGNGPYALAAVLTSGSTVSYTNAGLTTGIPYFYKVRAYRMVGTAKVHGDYSAAVSAKPVPAVPANVKAASASYNSVKLTWGAVTGASGYVVYRATSSSGAFTLAAVISSGSTVGYTNAGLTTGKTYYYKLRAYRTVGATKVYGDYSAVVSARTVPAAPASVKAASASYNSVKLTWSAVTGASGYVVYRATSSNGAFTLAAVIPSGSTASYTNAGLTTGKTYYYKMRAYRTVGATKVYGDYSAVVSARPIPALPTGVKAVRASATSIKLTWGAVTGASGYIVYRATSSAGAYTLVAVLPSGSTASYSNTGLTTGKTYYYKLRAYRTVGTTKVYSNNSTVVSAKP